MGAAYFSIYIYIFLNEICFYVYFFIEDPWGFQAKLSYGPWLLLLQDAIGIPYMRVDLFLSLNILSHFQIWSNDSGHCNRRGIKIEYFCFHFSCVPPAVLEPGRTT